MHEETFHVFRLLIAFILESHMLVLDESVTYDFSMDLPNSSPRHYQWYPTGTVYRYDIMQSEHQKNAC